MVSWTTLLDQILATLADACGDRRRLPDGKIGPGLLLNIQGMILIQDGILSEAPNS